MRKQTAYLIKEDIFRHREHLTMDEMKDLSDHVEFLVRKEEELIEGKKRDQDINREPPLRAMFMSMFTKKVSTPIIVYVGIGILGFLIGMSL